MPAPLPWLSLPRLVAAAVVASFLCPFPLIAIGALNQFKPVLSWIALPTLAITTYFLLNVLVRESSLTARIPRAAMAALVAASLFVNYALFGILANFTLFTRREYLGVLAAVFAGTFAVVWLVLGFSPVTRIELLLRRARGA